LVLVEQQELVELTLFLAQLHLLVEVMAEMIMLLVVVVLAEVGDLVIKALVLRLLQVKVM